MSQHPDFSLGSGLVRFQDLPRWTDYNVTLYQNQLFRKPQSFQLHCFADASEIDFGTGSYFKMTYNQSEINFSSMIRVTP